MKKIFFISFMVLGLSSVAEARCPADDMGCTKDDYEQKINDRIEQGKKEVWEARGVSKKVKAAGNTANDCADCATKVFTDSISGNSTISR